MVASLCQMGLGQPTNQNHHSNSIAFQSNQANFLPGRLSIVAEVDSRGGKQAMVQKSWVPVPLVEVHFSWKRFHILHNTIDFVLKVGLWLRLVIDRL